MQKLKLAAAVAGVITLAGCSDYDGSEVTREPTGPTFGYQFTDKESGDPISGTVTYKDHDGNVEEVYEVKDGAPDGTITYYFKNGDVSQHVVMSAGRMSGERKIYCDSNHDQLQMESDHGAEPDQ